MMRLSRLRSGVDSFENTDVGIFNEKVIKNVALLLTPVMMALSDALSAVAAVRYEINPKDKAVSLLYNDDKEGEHIRFRIVRQEDIGMEPTEKIFSSFFEKIRSTDTFKCTGVNYTINNRDKFNTFVQAHVDHYKKEQKIDGELTPQNVIKITSVVINSMPIVRSIDDKDKNFDPELKKRIDSTPLDEVIHVGGVCRHRVAAYIEIFNTIIALSGSPFIKNLHACQQQKLEKEHVDVVVYELMNEENKIVVNIAEIRDIAGTEGEHDIEEDTLFYSIRNQLRSAFLPEDRVAIVRGYVENKIRDEHKDPYAFNKELAFTYLSEIKTLLAAAENERAVNLFENADEYFKKWHKKLEKKEGQPYTILLSILSNIYLALADSENDLVGKISILERGFEFNFTFARMIARFSREVGDRKKSELWYEMLVDVWGEPMHYDETFHYFREIGDQANAKKILEKFERAIPKQLAIDRARSYFVLAGLYREIGDEDSYKRNIKRSTESKEK